MQTSNKNSRERLSYISYALFISVVVVFGVWVVGLQLLKFDMNLVNIGLMHKKSPLIFIIDFLPLGIIILIYFGYNFFNSIFSIKDHQIKEHSENIDLITDFSKRIGEKDFEATVSLSSSYAVLEQSLINMRDGLIEASQKDIERTTIVTGIAEAGEILRKQQNLSALSDVLLPFIIKKTDAILGAFYIINYNDKNEMSIDMIGSFGFNKKKYLQRSYKFAEGLIGAAVAEEDYIFRTEIPYEYPTITSGILGSKRPESILIVPLITDQKVFGVIELASLNIFSQLHIDFVNQLSDTIARTIFNLKVSERTLNLLTDVQNSEKRTHSLLENSGELIIVIDNEGIVKYVSPSIRTILGYHESDLINTSETLRIHEQGLDNYQKLIQNITSDNEGENFTQYQYKKKDGSYIWVEVIGTNLLEDPAVKGIVLNSRDITERRRAEKETRMRSQMQSLSENSPDVICRLNREKIIFYINPTVYTLTGLEVSSLQQKKLEETSLDKILVDCWTNVFETTIIKKKKQSSEVTIETEQGTKYMLVNAIPEFNEDHRVESVLLVSSDITERKLAEIEIQNTNKKIKESINYAQRIQSAILPEESLMKNDFPDSFMFYRPRDVVSGDFPWYMKTEDSVFIAVVDCTGHGVPGALLSLVGYFVMNDVVKNNSLSNPAQILDAVTRGVTKTLRQDEEGSFTKDGMDIGLCKINLKTKKVEYAGAHRPLYFYDATKKELIEYKGDKMAIGGGIDYKTNTGFTNFEIQTNPGDQLYVFSDGFTDQFGGPDNRKLTPSRTRAVVNENQEKSFSEIGQKFEETFYNWKGEGKQTDDVLLIGVKF